MHSGSISNSITRIITNRANCIRIYMAGNNNKNKNVPKITAAILYIVFI